jgi:anti-sigma-K factor RskA
MDHAELKDLLPLKALDRLDGDEARALDEHLASGCDECARELASFHEALAAMAIAETGDAPSDRVWARLQSRLDTTLPAGRIYDRGSQREPARRQRFAILGYSAAAALIAVVASSILFTTRVRRITSDTSDEIAALTARVVIVQRDLDAAGNKLAALQARVAQTTDLTLASLGADAHVAHLAGLAPAVSATGTVALNRAQAAAMLHVTGLPPVPDGRVYEVWWIGAKRGPLKAGLFEPLSQGATIVALNLPPPDEAILASAVTLEPTGGVEKPTGAMYLKGDFSRPK